LSIDAGEAKDVIREICSGFSDRKLYFNKELANDTFEHVYKGEIDRANKVIAILQEAKIVSPDEASI
jgi:hypothetical protein